MIFSAIALKSAMLLTSIASFWLCGKPSTESDAAKAKTLTLTLLDKYI